MDRTRGNMRSPPPKKVRFDLTRPKSTPPLSSSANFGTTEAIKRTCHKPEYILTVKA